MTVPPAASVSSPEVLTPTIRSGVRRSAYWIVIAVIVIVTGVVLTLISSAVPDTRPLSPSSAAPDGARAVAQVLGDLGVEIRTTDRLSATKAATAESSATDGTASTATVATTLLVHDPDAVLDAAQVRELLPLADRLVLLQPGTVALEELAPEVLAAGRPDDDPLEPACTLPAVDGTDGVSPEGSSYRLDPAAAPSDVSLCLRSDSPGGDPAFSLVQLDVEGTEVLVVGATGALTNGQITRLGNAAFALRLLGATPRLVWYQPSAADDGMTDATELTPGWLTPAILLLVLTAVVGAVWRGRRFGPLIVEDLPVRVPAGETAEGRARLYERAGARLHALDALRIGTVGRLASRCGLGRSAGLDEVVSAVAERLGTGEAGIRALLVDEEPSTDADLMRLSDALTELETTLARTVAP